jgi:hypothetical protein
MLETCDICIGAIQHRPYTNQGFVPIYKSSIGQRPPPPSAPDTDWQHSSSQLPIRTGNARWISSPSGRCFFARSGPQHSSRFRPCPGQSLPPRKRKIKSRLTVWRGLQNMHGCDAASSLYSALKSIIFPTMRWRPARETKRWQDPRKGIGS